MAFRTCSFLFISGNGIAMRWDWCEANPLVSSYVGGLDYSFNQVEEGIKAAIKLGNTTSTLIHGDATNVPLPDDSIDMFFTDPPY
jgi:ubiquinone/menaquinone biosynthesis C-methylase UbiE